MNLRDLEYVVRVADLGHFGRAAVACNVSQPTLSGQILKLEGELGVTIFERAGRQVLLTRAGEKIVAEARRAVDSARAIGAIAAASRDPLVGILRIGIIPTVAPYLTPRLLPKIAGALPQAPLTIVEDITDDLIRTLANGVLDAAIVASDVDSGRFETLALFCEPLSILMPAGHPLAARKAIRGADLNASTLLLLNEGHCLRDQALQFCRHPNFGLGTMADTRATSLETLLHLTAAGYGVTVVPALVLAFWEGMTDRIVARPLVGAQRHVRLAFRRDAPRRAALDKFASVVRDSVPPSRSGST